MKTKNIIDGLQILSKYYKADGYNVGAAHDCIYAYATDTAITEQDVQNMINLGWFQEDQCGDDGEFMAKHYAPCEGWMAYV